MITGTAIEDIKKNDKIEGILCEHNGTFMIRKKGTPKTEREQVCDEIIEFVLNLEFGTKAHWIIREKIVEKIKQIRDRQ